MSDLFPGFAEHRLKGQDAEIYCRCGGSGPPLLLVHGYPQTHMMWHKTAAELARHFTLIIPDLRGYGRSSSPPNNTGNQAYSKRIMAEDLVAVLDQLGHTSFSICGHDRGGRVAYRMALDHPDKVTRLAVLDIIPTHAMWHHINRDSALSVYHWQFLAQPHPFPETLIGHDPVYFLDHTIASWTGTKDLSAFDPVALADYRSCFSQPERIAASCNDYRAGASFDLKADEADFDAGNKITCPTLALWGNNGIPGKDSSDPLAVWRQWCSNVEGHGINAGHFVAEENPQETLEHLLLFLLQ